VIARMANPMSLRMAHLLTSRALNVAGSKTVPHR
jgi:hypothetical protein